MQTLSRNSFDDPDFEINESEIEKQVNMINFVSVKPEKLEKIKQETSKDTELQQLLKVVKEGGQNLKII